MMVEMLLKGGWMMVPLALCSLISLTIIVERFFYFRRLRATESVEQVFELVNKGKIRDGQELAGESTLPVMKVLSAGIANRADPGKAMEVAGITQYSTLKRGLPALDTIITLSPLLGLLGTIIGMINSFQVMAAVGGGGSPHAVTGGVAEALIATATGIAVAATTLIAYNYFMARVERESEIIEHYSTQLEMMLVRQ
jgi:biopolymer transport protein ExbB